MELKCPMAALFVLLLLSSSVYGAVISGGINEPGRKSGSVTVTIRNLRFYPEEITISPYTTVVWINEDRVPHKMVAYDRVFYGHRMNPGDKYAFTFVNEGTHKYFDAVFPKIGRGKIIVKENSDEVAEISLKEEKDPVFYKAYNHSMIYLVFLQKELLM